MDPLTIIGALSAILTLTEGMVVLTRRLHRCVRSAAKAPQQATYFFDEMSIFTDIMSLFHESATDAAAHLCGEQETKKARLIWKIERQCFFISGEMDEFVKTYTRTYGNSTTRLQIVWAQIRWSVNKPDTKELQLCMNATKANASFMMLYFQLHVEKSKKNEQNLKRVTMLEAQLKNAKQRVERYKRDLVVYREKLQTDAAGPPAEHLNMFLDDNHEIEEFVHEVVERIKERARHSQRQKRERQRRGPSGQGGSLPPSPRRPPSPPSDRPPPRGPASEIPVHEPSRTHTERPYIAEEQGQAPGSGRVHLVRFAQNSDGNQYRLRRAPEESVSELSPPDTRSRPPPIIAPRIRDNGTLVSEEFGEWPTDAYGSDESVTDDSHPPGNGDETARHPGRRNPPPGRFQDESAQPSEPAQHDVAREGREASESGSPGPWRPAPPFGGKGSRRRPRRPGGPSSSPSR
ncbi:hypothetical protein SCAR479_00790 [Seiridium cardinale]|uniref:Uncharacterized protein n=1 Tax=Seiridium cardinale TaxID=138064 RepID=A0ABR2Y6U5_9PEZI